MSAKIKSSFRLRKWIRQVIQKTMPRALRHAMLRRCLSLDFNPSPRLEVRLASSQSELEAALKLLHNSYVSAGFMDPHPSGLRVTKYHSLPATSTIIALWDGEVVGTLSLVRRSAFGMPLESIFDISHLTTEESRIFETSSLAVDPKFSGQHGKILFPLIKFLFEYGIHYFGSSYMAIAVNPVWIEFYEAILGFKLLSSKTVDNYSFVKGAPAVGAYLNLDTMAAELGALYKNAPAEKNLYNYLFAHDLPNLKYPERRFSKISDPVLTPESIDYLFNQKTQTFAAMTEREIFILHQLYQTESFQKVLPRLSELSNVFPFRNSSRLEVHLSGYILVPGEFPVPIIVSDISQNGIGIVTKRNLQEGVYYCLRIRVDGVEHFLPKTKVCWSSGKTGQRIGLTVTKPPRDWQLFVKLLTDDLLQNKPLPLEVLRAA